MKLAADLEIDKAANFMINGAEAEAEAGGEGQGVRRMPRRWVALVRAT